MNKRSLSKRWAECGAYKPNGKIKKFLKKQSNRLDRRSKRANTNTNSQKETDERGQ